MESVLSKTSPRSKGEQRQVKGACKPSSIEMLKRFFEAGKLQCREPQDSGSEG
jgi:hypothetical protein